MPSASQVPRKKIATCRATKQTTPRYLPNRNNQRGAGLASITDAALGCSDSGMNPAVNVRATDRPMTPPTHDANTVSRKLISAAAVRQKGYSNIPNSKETL